MTGYEIARQRLIDTVKTPENALIFMRRLLTDNDLPREELLLMLGEFCEKFPQEEGEDDRLRRGHIPEPPRSWRPAEVYLG